MDDFETRLTREVNSLTPGKAFRWAVMGIFAVTALGVVGSAVSFGPALLRKTVNPDAAISNYEAFHDRWKAYEARLGQIKSYATIIEGATGAQKTMAQVEREAMRSSCRDIAARYNADSTKSNRSIFKGQTAPETLNMEACNE